MASIFLKIRVGNLLEIKKTAHMSALPMQAVEARRWQ